MNHNISESKQSGIALLCNLEGIVLESVRDDFGIIDKIDLPASFKGIVEGTSLTKAEVFIREVKEKGAAFDWELNVRFPDGRIILLHFHGSIYGENIFIVGLSSAEVTSDFLNELSSISNDQAAALRDAMKKIFGCADENQKPLSYESYSKMTSLNNEMANLQRELYKKNAELERLNKLKNEFLGMAVHDLRNPLNAIMGFSQYLLDSSNVPLQPDQSRILGNIYSASRFMFRIVEELLDISSIESGSLNLDIKETDYVELIKNNIELNSYPAKQKNIEISFIQEDEIPLMKIDAGKIEQVLNNLISNAVKFSNSGSSINISIKRKDSKVITSVADKGQGIPEAEIEKVFKPFPKMSVKSTSGEKSTGLGLAIVKKIIEGHRGTVWVESRHGEGAVFSFSLSVDKPVKRLKNSLSLKGADKLISCC